MSMSGPFALPPPLLPLLPPLPPLLLPPPLGGVAPLELPLAETWLRSTCRSFASLARSASSVAGESSPEASRSRMPVSRTRSSGCFMARTSALSFSIACACCSSAGFTLPCGGCSAV